jgi:hypothetical protein
MNTRKLKPHVRRDLVDPLALCHVDIERDLEKFGAIVARMSPVDTRACLSYLRKANRSIRDAANDFVAEVEANAERIVYMKTQDRKQSRIKFKDFCFDPMRRHYYYLPTGDRWVAASIKRLFTKPEIAQIQNNECAGAPPRPRKLEPWE